MIVSLTGHREPRLGLPQDVSRPEWAGIREWLRNTIISYLHTNSTTIFITGMASGSDMAFGYVLSQLKDEGYNLEICCAEPCKNYNASDPWAKYVEDHAEYFWYAGVEYQKGADTLRDEHLANACNVMLAIFDGNKGGGAWSTMKKAKKLGKLVVCCPLVLYK